MNIKDLFFKKEAQIERTIQMGTSVLSLEAIKLPKPTESNSNDYIFNGPNNSFPNELIQLKRGCSIHNSILENKARFTVGNGIMLAPTKEASDAIYAGLDIITKAKIDYFINNINPNKDIDKVMYQVIKDWYIFGYTFILVRWSSDFERVTQIEYMDSSRMVIGKPVNNEISHFYYSKDWSNKKYTPTKYPVYNPELAKKNKEAEQIIYIKNEENGMDYYGLPTYFPSANDLKSVRIISEQLLNNVENGFAANVVVKTYNPGGGQSDEETDTFEYDFERQYSGVGRKILFFNNIKGQEFEPKIEALDVKNFDDNMIMASDWITQNIIVAHQVNPGVCGISVPHKLGYSNELEVSYKGFNEFVIKPNRKIFEKVLTTLFKTNGFNFNVYFEPLALDFVVTATKITK